MEDQLSLGERVEYIIKNSGWTVGKFKKTFAGSSISEQTIFNSTKPDANPQYDKLAVLIECLHKISDKPLSLEWLMFGTGRPYTKPKPIDQNEDFVLVPLLDLEVSAGPGTDGFSERIKDRIAFKASFMRRIGVDEKSAKACTVKGESMRLVYPHDSTVLIDTKTTTPYPGRDYVLLHEGMLRLKRVESVTANLITIKSMYHENDADNERESITSASEVIFRGMVRWKGMVV